MSMEKLKFQKEFGSRMKQVRLNVGLSQIEFAERIETSQPTIVRLEAGSRQPEAYLVKMIAEQFRCNVEWLLSGKGDFELK